MAFPISPFLSLKYKFMEIEQRPAPRGRSIPSVESKKEAFDSGLPAHVGAKQGASAFLALTKYFQTRYNNH